MPKKNLWVFSLPLFIFLVYLSTLHPSVPGGDSGMIIGSAYTLGVSHPPGYPLFTMLGHLFSYLPFGSIGFRINLMTALLSACSSLVFLLLLLRLKISRIPALVVIGLYAFSPLIWEYSVVTEFFSMNNLFVLLLLYVAHRFYESKQKRFAYWGAFLFGLGLTNHHTLLFVGTPLVLFTFWHGRKELFKVPILLRLSSLFFLALTPYIYLPLSAAQMHFVTWGDQSTVEGFFTHFFRKEFGTFKLGTAQYFAGTSFWHTLWLYVKSLFNETFFGLALILAIVGFYRYVYKKRSPFLLLLTGIYFFYIIVFHVLSNFDLTQELFLAVTMRFWQLPNIFIFLFAAFGLHYLQDFIPRKVPHALLLLLPILPLTLNYRDHDRSQDKIFIEWGQRFLGGLPANAILLSKGDINLNILKYIQSTSYFRQDVKILDQELLKTDWYRKWVHKNYPDVKLPLGHLQRFPNMRELGAYTLEELIAINIDRFEIYKMMEKEFEKSVGRYPLRPMGKLWQVLAPPLTGNQITFDYQTYMAEHKRRLFPFIDICKYPKQTKIWEKLVSVTFQRSLEFSQFYLHELVKHDINSPFGQQVMRDNIEWGEIMLRECSEIHAFAYKNLGLFYFNLAGKTPEQKRRLKEIWQKFIELDDSGDKSIPWMKTVIAGL